MVSFKVHACTPDLSKVLKKALMEVIEKDMKKEGDTFQIKRKYCYVPPQ
jgi:spore coat protein CotF